MASKHKDLALWEEYKRQRNKVTHEINAQQKVYYNREITSNKKSGQWYVEKLKTLIEAKQI